jgi:hypothetical protein
MEEKTMTINELIDRMYIDELFYKLDELAQE